MAANDIPYKIYYNWEENKLQNSAGEDIVDDDLLPQTFLGQVFRVNLQLVIDASNTSKTDIPTGTTITSVVDSDYQNPGVLISLRLGNGNWTSGTGNEYYTTEVTSKPDYVYLEDVEATEGTVGALNTVEWGWDSDNSRLYVRLTDDTDPDTKTVGYIQIKNTNASETRPFIEVNQDTFNVAGSWWNGSTWVDPDITQGQVSFLVEADKYDFYNRLGSSDEVTGTKMFITFLQPSTAIPFDFITMYWRCINRPLGADPISVGVTAANYYNKAEVLALLAAYTTKVADGVPLTLSATPQYINLGAYTTYTSWFIRYEISESANRRNGIITVYHDGTTADTGLDMASGNYDFSSVLLEADWNSGNVRLKVTGTVAGETFKYSIMTFFSA